MMKIKQLTLPSKGVLLLLLLCVFVLLEGAYGQDNPQVAPPEVYECSPWEIQSGCSEGEFLQINGTSLYFEVRGQGESLLLMHGGGGSAEHFNHMLPELTKHFRVITPDSRAQGRSTDTTELPVSYRLMVDDMIGLLDSLGIDSAYVGGYCDGAAIAMYMAIYYPERVRALLLTPVDLSSEGLTELFWEKAKQWKFPEKLNTLWFQTRISPTEDELAGIHVPSLFVIGQEEEIVKLEHVAWQYQTIPGAEVVWISEANHSLVVNKAEEVNEAFILFLNRHR